MIRSATPLSFRKSRSFREFAWTSAAGRLHAVRHPVNYMACLAADPHEVSQTQTGSLCRPTCWICRSADAGDLDEEIESKRSTRDPLQRYECSPRMDLPPVAGLVLSQLLNRPRGINGCTFVQHICTSVQHVAYSKIDCKTMSNTCSMCFCLLASPHKKSTDPCDLKELRKCFDGLVRLRQCFLSAPSHRTLR